MSVYVWNVAVFDSRLSPSAANTVASAVELNVSEAVSAEILATPVIVRSVATIDAVPVAPRETLVASTSTVDDTSVTLLSTTTSASFDAYMPRSTDLSSALFALNTASDFISTSKLSEETATPERASTDKLFESRDADSPTVVETVLAAS
jgi:hypothetical protein